MSQMMIDEIGPLLKQNLKPSYIGLAILCLYLHRVYTSFTVPPPALDHFPRVSFFSIVKSLFVNEAVAERTKRLINPITAAGHKFYTCKIPFTWTIFCADPIAAKTVLLKTENFPKSHGFFDTLGEQTPAVQFLGRENVAVSNGEKWKKQRKIMNPAFLRSMPVKTFCGVVPDLFAKIDEDYDHVPIRDLMKAFTIDVLGKSAFGFDFQSLRGDPEGWTSTYSIVISALFNPWLNIFAKVDFLFKYISPQRRRVMQATDKFNQMLERLTERRREEILQGDTEGVPEGEKDLLTLMIEADIREDNETSTQELRHNVATFFLAGHDTTAHTLAFCLYNLAKYKDAQRKAREEVLSILGDDPVDVSPTPEDLKKMDYLTMVIKENLRRYGPVDRMLARDVVEDISICGVFIPKGQRISVDFNAIHMNPNTWHNPEEFIPERFEPGGEHEQHRGFAWVPFSNGSRQCIGMNFSLAEQRVVLSMLLKRYDIDISKDSIHYDKVKFDSAFTFAPGDLRLIFTKRY